MLPRVHRGAQVDAPRHSLGARDPFLSLARWKRCRVMFLRRHPVCVDPFGIHAAGGQVVPAAHVDHIVPRVIAPDLALDWGNLQSLCVSCHSRKTNREQRS